jgi:hypothetical protein
MQTLHREKAPKALLAFEVTFVSATVLIGVVELFYSYMFCLNGDGLCVGEEGSNTWLLWLHLEPFSERYTESEYPRNTVNVGEQKLVYTAGVTHL